MLEENTRKVPHQRLSADDEIDVKEIWRIIRSSRKSIFLIFSAIIAITIYVTLTTPPLWEAATAVMIKDRGSEPSSLLFDLGMNNSQQRLQNEIEVLKSYYLHNQVVGSLIDDGSATKLALFGTRYTRKRYRIKDYFIEWLAQDPASTILPENLTNDQRIKIVQNLRKSTNITSIRDTDVLNIAINSSDSADAVFLANRIGDLYRNIDLQGGLGELQFVLTFLDSQITRYEKRLATVEDDMRKFKSDNQIYSLDGSADLLLKDLTNYETIYYTNIAELEVAQQRVNYLKNQLSDSEQALMEEITNTNNPMIVALRGRIAELEAQKVQQMVDEGWNEQSLQARDFNRRIVEMKGKLTNITESLILSGWSEEDPFAASQEIFNRIVEQQVEVHAARARAAEYKKLLGQMSDRLKKLPNQTLQYARLDRTLRLNENLYLTMKQKFEESRITEAGQRGKVRILDPAFIAKKVKPDKKTNILLGIIIGLSFGVAFAFLKEFLDYTIKAVEQLERKGIAVLGIIPDMQHKSNSSAFKKTTPPPKEGMFLNDD